MKQTKLILILLSILQIAACGTSGDKRITQQVSCQSAEQTSKPNWVVKGMIIPGYYSGIGVARITRNGTELALATQRATADLSASVHTSVSRSITAISKEQGQNGVSFSEAENEVITKAATQLSMENVRRIDTWRDGKNCQLWALVRVDEATVKKNVDRSQSQKMLARAERLYDAADDATQVLDTRIENMEMAISILKEVKFNLLPTQKLRFYQGPYDKRLAELMSQMKGRETLVLINAKNPKAIALKPEIANQILPLVAGSWYKQKQNCRSLNACVEIARRERAKRLVLIEISTNYRDGSMGSVIGEVDIKVGMYTVSTGKPLVVASRTKGEVFSFGEQVDWSLAIQRAFEQEPAKVTLKQLGTCEIGVC